MKLMLSLTAVLASFGCGEEKNDSSSVKKEYVAGDLAADLISSCVLVYWYRLPDGRLCSAEPHRPQDCPGGAYILQRCDSSGGGGGGGSHRAQ